MEGAAFVVAVEEAVLVAREPRREVHVEGQGDGRGRRRRGEGGRRQGAERPGPKSHSALPGPTSDTTAKLVAGNSIPLQGEPVAGGRCGRGPEVSSPERPC